MPIIHNEAHGRFLDNWSAHVLQCESKNMGETEMFKANATQTYQHFMMYNGVDVDENLAIVGFLIQQLYAGTQDDNEAHVDAMADIFITYTRHVLSMDLVEPIPEENGDFQRFMEMVIGSLNAQMSAFTEKLNGLFGKCDSAEEFDAEKEKLVVMAIAAYFYILDSIIVPAALEYHEQITDETNEVLDNIEELVELSQDLMMTENTAVKVDFTKYH